MIKQRKTYGPVLSPDILGIFGISSNLPISGLGLDNCSLRACSLLGAAAVMAVIWSLGIDAAASVTIPPDVDRMRLESQNRQYESDYKEQKFHVYYYLTCTSIELLHVFCTTYPRTRTSSSL